MKIYKCDNCGKEINANNSSYSDFLNRLQSKGKVKNDDILISMSVNVFDSINSIMKYSGYQQIIFSLYREVIRYTCKDLYRA